LKASCHDPDRTPTRRGAARRRSRPAAGRGRAARRGRRGFRPGSSAGCWRWRRASGPGGRRRRRRRGRGGQLAAGVAGGADRGHVVLVQGEHLGHNAAGGASWIGEPALWCPVSVNSRPDYSAPRGFRATVATAPWSVPRLPIQAPISSGDHRGLTGDPALPVGFGLVGAATRAGRGIAGNGAMLRGAADHGGGEGPSPACGLRALSSSAEQICTMHMRSCCGIAASGGGPRNGDRGKNVKIFCRESALLFLNRLNTFD